MSAPTDAHDRHEADGHADEHDTHSHGSRRSYLIGFLLSVVLTAIPFWIVMSGAIADRNTATVVVIAFAIAQILVHTVAFLHVNAKSENGWTLMAMAFTAVVVFITISGSLWIMFHLNNNMMPMPPGDAGTM